MTRAEIVWLRDDSSRTRDDLAAGLTPDEQATLANLAHPERQRRFLLSRLLLRRLLSAHLPADDIRFTRAASGRLLLAGESGWHVSLSHAGDGVAVIVSTQPCGIDIEVPRPVAMEKIAARHFAPAEADALAHCTNAERETLFFRLWTLKEASVKALGEGLANNMARLAFDVADGQPRLRETTVGLQLWQRHEAPFHIAAAIKTKHEVEWRVQQMTVAAL